MSYVSQKKKKIGTSHSVNTREEKFVNHCLLSDFNFDLV